MSFLKPFIASAALLLAVPAGAQSFDQDISCGAVLKTMDKPSPDRTEVKQVLDYTLQTMQDLDRLHRLRGQREILPQMSEGGRTSIALIVIGRCRGREALTLTDTAIETYEAIRTIRTSLALNHRRRRWANRALARPTPEKQSVDRESFRSSGGT